MAEQLSSAGVAVFAADIKGDLSGVSQPGQESEKLLARTKTIGQEWTATGFPTEFYALGGQGTGIPIRATITSFGPVLLSKVLSLNDVQESSLGLIFHYADKQGLTLLDLKDLRAVITHLTSDEGKGDLKELGGLSAATAGVILRALIGFADQGAEAFFGEPEFDTADLLQQRDGKGVISLLELPNLQDRPGSVLHLPDVAAGRSVPRPARGRRCGQAEAGLLLRRGTPAVQRRLEGVPGLDRADRPADPVEGCRRLLRHPDPEGRAGRRPGAARFAGPASVAGAHAERREGTEGDRLHLPELVVRPGRGADPARYRRGDRDGDEREGRADPGRVDPAAGAAVADGAGPRRSS